MTSLLGPLRNAQTVSLTDIEVETEVGIAEWERVPGKTQRLLVDVEMAAESDRFDGTTIDDCFDYDRVYRHVTDEWPQRPHTDLLETLAESLIRFCLEDQRVAACRVRIRKPHVYNGRGIPSVEFVRFRTGSTASP